MLADRARCSPSVTSRARLPASGCGSPAGSACGSGQSACSAPTTPCCAGSSAASTARCAGCARVEVRVSESARGGGRSCPRGERPVVVLSRHAGEGDSLLVLHELLCRHGRRPRVVHARGAAAGPADRRHSATGCPTASSIPRGGDTEIEIAAMARGPGRERRAADLPRGRELLRRRGAARRSSGSSGPATARRPHGRAACATSQRRGPGGALAAIDGGAGGRRGLHRPRRVPDLAARALAPAARARRPSRCGSGSCAPRRSRPITMRGSTGSSAGGGRSTRWVGEREEQPSTSSRCKRLGPLGGPRPPGSRSSPKAAAAIYVLLIRWSALSMTPARSLWSRS